MEFGNIRPNLARGLRFYLARKASSRLTLPIVHGEVVFIFRVNDEAERMKLLTVYRLPSSLCAAIRKSKAGSLKRHAC